MIGDGVLGTVDGCPPALAVVLGDAEQLAGVSGHATAAGPAKLALMVRVAVTTETMVLPPRQFLGCTAPSRLSANPQPYCPDRRSGFGKHLHSGLVVIQ